MINVELRGASGSIERMNDDDDDGDDERVRESVYERCERRKDRMTGKAKECLRENFESKGTDIEKESSLWPSEQPTARKERNILVYVFLVNSNSSIADFKSIYRHNNINIIIVILYTTAESVMNVIHEDYVAATDIQHTCTRHTLHT